MQARWVGFRALMSIDWHAENSLPADHGALQWWKKEEQPGDPSWTRVLAKSQAVISTLLSWPNSLGTVSGNHWGPEACAAVPGLTAEETEAGRKPRVCPRALTDGRSSCSGC